MIRFVVILCGPRGVLSPRILSPPPFSLVLVNFVCFLLRSDQSILHICNCFAERTPPAQQIYRLYRRPRSPFRISEERNLWAKSRASLDELKNVNRCVTCVYQRYLTSGDRGTRVTPYLSGCRVREHVRISCLGPVFFVFLFL